ncbi:preprotein translocase subunit SecA [Streptomyces vietnamensis]|uniref:preprotein translocase subunit SecA n=1 Tax=Streptomyces vietnamensis TaxID=362257 RepID=UPI0034441E94
MRNKKQRHRSSSAPPVTDPHVQMLVNSVAELTALMATLDGEDPAAAADAAFTTAVDGFVEKVVRFDAIRLIEVARQRFLPFTAVGNVPNPVEANTAHLELLTLVAYALQQDAEARVPAPSEFQEMSQYIAGAAAELDKILHLAQLRSFAATDPADQLASVSLLIRSAEVWMRNSSYPEMVTTTNLALLDGNPGVRAALKQHLGFDAHDALAVLSACNDLQLDALNQRLRIMGATVTGAMAATQKGRLDDEVKESARSSLLSVFEPSADQATVSVEDITARTGIPAARVTAVVEQFRLDLRADTAADVIDAFTTGRNPLRARPLLVTGNGRLMLPHPALYVFAVRENLEEYLKTLAPVWSQYAKHRGELLESRTRRALDRVFPGARFRDAFEYYVPANDDEAQAADPAKYTKRVEGDHLIVVDDVAVIVEDKAVALSALSRGGKKTRIRTDLTGIITKAAEQSGRMRDAIERDGGLRVEKEGWVDLSGIREIHTIAVSLDDISTVLTATAELVRAGLLSIDNIPWTVSLHDLELITELVAHPAQFLLYLRRRRDPDVTVLFHAPDELDLFLYFFEAGLFVEPDPVQVRAAFPFLPEPTAADLRRYNTQTPALVTSRTDALDAWFHARRHGSSGAGTAPKPAMAPAPLLPLAEELRTRDVQGWLSIGATLLALESTTQRKAARYGDTLLDNPNPSGQGRSLAMPLTPGADPAEGWLLTWATRPAGHDPDAVEKSARDYLRAKKHQLGLPRGVVFLYDEATRELAGAFYDGHIGPLDAALTATVHTLRPATDLRTLHPNAKRPPRRGKATKQPAK